MISVDFDCPGLLKRVGNLQGGEENERLVDSIHPSMTERDSLAALQAENNRLVALLEQHGLEWRLAPQKPDFTTSTEEPAGLVRYSVDAKVAMFRRLFRGRTDVYPVRWDSKASGKSGYSPACANEWQAGVCDKPRIKYGDCAHRSLIPLSDPVVYKHLAGQHTIGVYPLLEDDTCCFLAVDLDEAQWQEDALAFMRSCRDLGIPAALEISRSGKGAHA